jgi:hypothetical protein
MKNLIFIFTLFLVTSCTTVEFVRKDTSPHKQGILRHAPTSSKEKEEKYRAKIDNAAKEFCGGPYQITKEYEAKAEMNVSTGLGTGFGFGHGAFMLGSSTPSQQMYDFVEFTCNE